MDAAGGGSGWRSEEDYLFARLANSFGYLAPDAIDDVLRRQAANAAAGLPLTFSQVVTRDKLLTGEALLHVKQELARCEHRCPSCGIRRYLVPTPEPREEPCLRCGAAIPVAPRGTNVTDTQQRRRRAAIHGGSRAERLAEQRLRASQEEELPRPFGPYLLEALIARGAMGAVYQARTAAGEPVALKLLLAGAGASAAQRHRFRREAKAQSGLDHPHIARVRDAGEVEGVPYQAMDLVTGGDLARAYADLDQAQRVAVLAKVARAIAFAHEAGYIHRDLKLGNVLLTAEREPKVTDFGLTKHLEGHTRLTQEGAVVGTPFYMSPEQVTGRVDDIGPKSDIYALGVMLYELCTGALPFVAESSVELARMILERKPPAFAEHGVLAVELEQVAFRAMEKDPELRYPDAASFAEDLERIGRGEAPQVAKVAASERVARQMQRHGRSLKLLAAVTVAGLALLVGLALGFRAYRAGVVRDRALRVCGDALSALEAKLETAPWGAAPPPACDGLVADAQRALDEEAGRGLAPADRAPLLERLRAAMRGLAARHLRSGTCAGARRARELVVDAGAADDPAAAAVAARAALRLGLDLEPALKLLPPDHPEAKRVEGIAQLLGGAPTGALPLLASTPPDATPFAALDARGYHALALLGAGKTEAGEAALATLRAEAEGDARRLWRLADLHLLAGRTAEARALSAAAGPPPATGQELAARAAAVRGDPTAEDLDALVSAIEAEDPRDLPPPPLLARAMRDAAWALRASPGGLDRARALVERARLRAFDDLDLLFLAARLAPERHGPRLKAVSRAALLDLDRPLGRGVFLARVAQVRTGASARKLRAEAQGLLAPLGARWPGFEPLQDTLARLRGDAPAVRLDDPSGWGALLPPVKPPPKPAPRSMRERLRRLRREANATPEGTRERIGLLEQALRLDPANGEVAFKLAEQCAKQRPAQVEGYLRWFTYLRVRPHLGFCVFLQLRRQWAQAFLLRGFKPAPDLARAQAAPEPPADLPLAAALQHLFGRIYAEGPNEPVWPTCPDAELRRELDRILLGDPYLWGFLGLRGQLLEALGDAAGCERAFALLHQLSATRRYRGNFVHHAWATAKTRPTVAVEAIGKLELEHLSGDQERRGVLEFMSLDPLMLGVRETSALMRLKASGRKRPR